MVTILLVSMLLGGAPDAEPLTDDKYRQVVADGLKFLDDGGAKLEKGAACLNCHHAPLRNWALRDASRVGVSVDVKALEETTDAQLKKLMGLKDGYRNQQWGHSLSSLYVLGAKANDMEPLPQPVASDLAKIIVAEQSKEGTWKAAQQFANQRRPKRDADEVQTMWSILALSRLESQEGANEARDRAVEKLAAIEPGTTIDSRVLRILVEHQVGKPERVEQLITKLLETQHEDGGWGWQTDDPSEAWPVGMTLYVLGSLGEKTPTAAVEKGRAFLAKTQTEDGSWRVEGKLTKDHKMASYFGTAWAVIGVSRTLPKR